MLLSKKECSGVIRKRFIWGVGLVVAILLVYNFYDFFGETRNDVAKKSTEPVGTLAFGDKTHTNSSCVRVVLVKSCGWSDWGGAQLYIEGPHNEIRYNIDPAKLTESTTVAEICSRFDGHYIFTAIAPNGRTVPPGHEKKVYYSRSHCREY